MFSYFIDAYLSNVKRLLVIAKMEAKKSFAQEQELSEKQERLSELNALMNINETGDSLVDFDDGSEGKAVDFIWSDKSGKVS